MHRMYEVFKKLENVFNNKGFEYIELNPKNRYVQLRGKQGIIGNNKIHYEFLCSGSGENMKLSVELHFETIGDNKWYREELGDSLPGNLCWRRKVTGKDDSWEWIYLKESTFKLKNYDLSGDSTELGEQILETLETIDNLIGDKVRSLISKKALLKKQTQGYIMNKPLNTILYGPPGTGKTYNTINKALEICGVPKGETRQETKESFDKLVEKGQVIFTTFHQSMSYEDFVEGIKPNLGGKEEKDANSLEYIHRDGIFKIACARAAYNNYISDEGRLAKDYSFDSLYAAFIQSVKVELKKDEDQRDYSKLVFKSLQNKDIEIKEINRNNSIIARAKDSTAERSAPLTKARIKLLYDKFSSIDKITKGLDDVRETVQIKPRTTEFYAIFRGLKDFEKNYYQVSDRISEEIDDYKSLLDEESLSRFNEGEFWQACRDAHKEKKGEPVVLIIDEINRGNVASIFGELITLIEKDKRVGGEEELLLTLPYSQQKIGVPSNLYIIGTMNTADRSVEALDAALRRRFSFVEMPPKSNLIKGELQYEDSTINLSKLLDTINHRIEVLLDKDHKIGHSYFMKVTDIDSLKLVFKDKIIPLLEEYFFGDYSKIGLILGKGFVESKQKVSFANFEESIDGADRKLYQIKRDIWGGAKFIKALKSLGEKICKEPQLANIEE